MDPGARQGWVADVASGRLRTGCARPVTLMGIAATGGFSPADVEADFGGVDALLARLVAPLCDALEQLAGRMTPSPMADASGLRDVVCDYVDVLVRHRLVAAAALGDPAVAVTPAALRVRSGIVTLRDQLAGGPESGLCGRIRTASALGAVQQAVLELPEGEPAPARDVLVDAAVAILLS